MGRPLPGRFRPARAGLSSSRILRSSGARDQRGGESGGRREKRARRPSRAAAHRGHLGGYFTGLQLPDVGVIEAIVTSGVLLVVGSVRVAAGAPAGRFASDSFLNAPVISTRCPTYSFRSFSLSPVSR